MIVVSCNRGHNASTVLMVDGDIIFYLEEERLSRMKYDGSPLLGLAEVFKYVDHIDHLVITHTHQHGPQLDYTGEGLYEGYIRKLAKTNFVFQLHEIYLNHHQMHAACSFYNSGFETAACVVVDGAGSFLQIDNIDSTCYEFETIFNASYPNTFDVVYKHIGTTTPIGFYHDKVQNVYITEQPGITKAYEAVTSYCGFSSIEAGKTMGLAPYGKVNVDLPNIVGSDGFVDRKVIKPFYPNGAFIIQNKYNIIDEDIKKHEQNVFTNIQKDFAYKIQHESEQYLIKLIQKATELTDQTNIVISGGYGLNCVANYKYLKEFPNLNIYCEPISHDGGTSIGAAKLVYNSITKNITPKKQKTVYYGPQYDTNEYQSTIDKYDFIQRKVSAKDVAELIADKNIVCIYQGRSEGGPRALGNRSILFDPRVKNGKDIVNEVKRREWFRPFAGSVLEEDVHEWFDLAGRDSSPHMMYAVECKPGVEDKVPSIIHVDGTCRIQTVNIEDNKNYYNLILEFKQLTGVPILFNTSFNLAGEPLVETLDDALNTISRSDLSYLYLPEIQTIVTKR